jgi:uncharacterized protein (DUF1697 family)
MNYSAFLRAINVGGHGLIKMPRLKELFESSGLEKVQTYIQSGNIVFSSPVKNSAQLEKQIETFLFNEMDYVVKTFLRTGKEIENIINKNPFNEISLSKELVLYYAFLQSAPGKETEESILSSSNDIERHKIMDRGIYSLIDKTAVKTLYSGSWLEKKLNQPVTVRNWNTILKINQMMNSHPYN